MPDFAYYSLRSRSYGRLQQGPASQDSEKEPTCTKIYYASRTHSQLSQVLHELHKLKLKLNIALPHAKSLPDSRPPGKRPSSAVDDEDKVYGDEEGSGPRAVSLGSRKQLCIHERLREKAGDLDEACRQMLGGTPTVPACRTMSSGMKCREGKETVSASADCRRRDTNAGPSRPNTGM